MKKLIALFVLAVVSVAAMAQATRNTIVTGTVVFAGDGEPLPGATVMQVDGKTGVVTDIDGKFAISVPAMTKKLRFSYVGMVTRDVEITPGTPMYVQLSSADNQLNEVVVTAMGMKRDRKALGYAVQDLKAEDLNTDGTTSLASAMQGKLTGVDIRPSSGAPGASSQIVIRGARSFITTTYPATAAACTATLR